MKWTKVPIHPTGASVSTTDAKTLATFEECYAAYTQGGRDGIGFVTLEDDSYVLIDLDHVLDRATGKVEPWASDMLEAARAEGAYVELSPSGTGFHIYGRGEQGFVGAKRNECEIYCRGRYFTTNGWVPKGFEVAKVGKIAKTISIARARIGEKSKAGEPIKPDQAGDAAAGGTIVPGKRPYAADMSDDKILEDYAYHSASGPRLKRLLDGDISDYPSNSEADLACASMLGFWFYNDPAKVEDVMRGSALAREKWDDNKKYLSRTIQKALGGKTEYFSKPEPTPGAPAPEGAKTGEAKPTPNTFDYTQHMRGVQELLDNPPPPIEYLVEDFVARGSASLMIGKPKSYKTTILIQVGTALAGNPALLAKWSDFNTLAKGTKVAFLDLEQNDRIFYEQMTRLGLGKVSASFKRITEFPKLDAMGVEVLREMIVKEKFTFIIIDSLARVKPDPARGGNVFADDAATMQRITNLAHELNVHIMVVAHAGKRDAADNPMEMIAGTNGLTASVDDVFVWFTSEPDEGDTKRRNLFMSGRNIRRPGTYVLEKKDSEPLFTLMGSEDQVIKGEGRQKILQILGFSGPMTPSAIAKAVGVSAPRVHQVLKELIAKKLVMPFGNGKYSSRNGALKAGLQQPKEEANELFR
jgi:hypothetical protein